jgi:hypothetical protein
MSRRLPARHRQRQRKCPMTLQSRLGGEPPDAPRVGRHCLGAAALALDRGDDRVARKLLDLAGTFIAQSRASVALAREQIRLNDETEAARRAARVAWYNAVGATVEEVEIDLQIEEDAERIRRARQAGYPVEEPRWEASWAHVGGRRKGEGKP